MFINNSIIFSEHKQTDILSYSSVSKQFQVPFFPPKDKDTPRQIWFLSHSASGRHYISASRRGWEGRGVVGHQVLRSHLLSHSSSSPSLKLPRPAVHCDVTTCRGLQCESTECVVSAAGYLLLWSIFQKETEKEKLRTVNSVYVTPFCTLRLFFVNQVDQVFHYEEKDAL